MAHARLIITRHIVHRCNRTDEKEEPVTLQREHVQALRLVSRTFATLETLCDALYRNIKFLVTEESLTKLQSLALHPRLRHFPVRITFIAPLIHKALTKQKRYNAQIENEVRRQFSDKIGRPDGCSYKEREAMVCSWRFKPLRRLRFHVSSV